MLNVIALMGRLTRDPELRQTQNGKSVASFTLAVSRSFSRDETDFVDIVAWGKTAEFADRYFRKGQLVAVNGRLQTRTWEDKEGNKRKSTEVIAQEVHFAESKRAADPSDEYEEISGEGLPF